MKRFWILFLAVTAVAQTPKPPSIPEAVKLKFFKASSEAQASSAQAQQAAQVAKQKQDAYQAVVKELRDACGKDFEPTMDKAGDPACGVKPEPEKKP